MVHQQKNEKLRYIAFFRSEPQILNSFLGVLVEIKEIIFFQILTGAKYNFSLTEA